MLKILKEDLKRKLEKQLEKIKGIRKVLRITFNKKTSTDQNKKADIKNQNIDGVTKITENQYEAEIKM